MLCSDLRGGGGALWLCPICPRYDSDDGEECSVEALIIGALEFMRVLIEGSWGVDPGHNGRPSSTHWRGVPRPWSMVNGQSPVVRPGRPRPWSLLLFLVFGTARGRTSCVDPPTSHSLVPPAGPLRKVGSGQTIGAVLHLCVGYMQVTSAQLRRWDDDPNQ